MGLRLGGDRRRFAVQDRAGGRATCVYSLDSGNAPEAVPQRSTGEPFLLRHAYSSLGK
jgi:hypothetical protein